jgi:hypothetical protein
MMLPSFALLLLALIVLGYGIFDVMESTQTCRWKVVPCELQKIEIVDTPAQAKPFAMEVSFRYQWNGQWHRSTRYCLETAGSRFYQPLAMERDDWLATKELGEPTCRVNAANPSEAVLKPGEVSTGGLIACFVGICLSVMFGQLVWLMWHRQLINDHTPTVALPFLTILAVFGSFMLGSGVAPYLEYSSSKDWPSLSANVIWSKVREEHVSRKSGRYTIFQSDIFYRYTFNGQAYCSNGVSIYPSDSEDLKSANNVAQQYPAGAAVTCYVNPAQPWQAVRDRDWHYSGLLLPLFGLPFAVIGIWGIIGAIRAMLFARKISKRAELA